MDDRARSITTFAGTADARLAGCRNLEAVAAEHIEQRSIGRDVDYLPRRSDMHVEWLRLEILISRGLKRLDMNLRGRPLVFRKCRLHCGHPAAQHLPEPATVQGQVVHE